MAVAALVAAILRAANDAIEHLVGRRYVVLGCRCEPPVAVPTALGANVRGDRLDCRTIGKSVADEKGLTVRRAIMVHHFCIMRPIRSLFGLILLAGAVLCFYRASEHAQFATSLSEWFNPISAKKIVALKPPIDDSGPIPNPPQPSSDGDSPRPSWVDRPAHLELHDGVYVATATAGPYPTLDECEQALPAEIDRAVNDFAEKEFQPAVDQPVKLDRDEIKDHLIKDRFPETVTTSFGPMQQEHVLLEFGSQVRAAIADQWRAIVILQRLLYTARVAGTCFLALGGVYLLLRWKPATR
jgi:hypothetical protein